MQDLLRFMTCGSVDDGKSTLIGRFLFDAAMLYEDQVSALRIESKRTGTQDGEPDYALLLDGLIAERAQGITIDVGYRYFATTTRKYIVADAPGHEQYTRNMVTAASTADAAILLVDARKGVLTQTRRHTHLLALLGVRHVLLAVNKMDLVGYSEASFRDIETGYRRFAQDAGFADPTCIPLSALKGDTILAHGSNMAWYRGPTLLDYLEGVEVDASAMQRGPFRMPVQWVNRPNQDFRGVCGTIMGGTIQPGTRVCSLPSGKESTVARIVTHGGDLFGAVAGQSITLTLDDDLDIGRGDLLCAADAPAGVTDQFRASIVWMDDAPLLPGRSYWFNLGAMSVGATVSQIRYKVDVHSQKELAARQLALNEIGVCNLATDRPIAFDPYADNRDTGGFILIDRLTNNTVGAGLVQFALRRAENIQVQDVAVNKGARAHSMGQKPCILWFTGLSGAGKSTIANAVEKELHALGRNTYLLDGDNVRHGLNRDLGFTDAERVENIRRVAEVAKLMVDAGLIVLVSFISPFRSERRLARSLVEEGEFIEIFVDAPLEVVEARDPKGLYKKARRGELPHFTGIDSAYEIPEAAELRIDSAGLPVQQAVNLVMDHLRQANLLPPKGTS